MDHTLKYKSKAKNFQEKRKENIWDSWLGKKLLDLTPKTIHLKK